ncbi:unnamed protein product [Cuscuta campestris]|uniref:Uncharacterized protein n=1 Tax=Cuscuta campestris TaxID=132261 RepID=A0A484KKS3_9ASTE|nr:unnamed protein product [Cuscuta campestris]
MKENQPEILCVNGVNEEDLSMGKKGVFGSNGIVSESKNDRGEFQKALPQLQQDDPLSDHSFASIENKLHVSPPRDDDDDDGKKEAFHVVARKPDEEVALLLSASDEKATPLDGKEESKCHNPITDLCVVEVAETGKEHFGDDGLIDRKPREDKILEGQNAVPRDESCNGEDNKTKPNRSILSLQDHFAEGEASFSALGFAGSSHPASVPYSGSTSLRSDSSTTSARSFAFPVLQPEWISSPVRMRKSYNRFWKHGGRWRRLLCCRF